MMMIANDKWKNCLWFCLLFHSEIKTEQKNHPFTENVNILTFVYRKLKAVGISKILLFDICCRYHSNALFQFAIM